MKIETMRMEDIRPYERNAKKHPKSQIEQIKRSIQEFGNNDPIAVDEDGVIIEGHGRYQALKELGYLTAEVIVLRGMSEEQKDAYRLVHNQLTMNSGLDLEVLAEELNRITGIDMQFYDFNILDEPETKDDDFDEDAALDEIGKEPKSKRGEVYRLGDHCLMCGDSTSEDDVSKLMSDFEGGVLMGFKPTSS